MDFEHTVKDVYEEIIAELRHGPELEDRIELYSILSDILKAMALNKIGDNLPRIG